MFNSWVHNGAVNKAVGQFFNPDGTLIHIPARSSKKVEVLKLIAKRFQAEVVYTERELNQILSEIHPDTAAIRRHMIVFGIMERDAKSNYWLTQE